MECYEMICLMYFISMRCLGPSLRSISKTSSKDCSLVVPLKWLQACKYWSNTQESTSASLLNPQAFPFRFQPDTFHTTPPWWPRSRRAGGQGWGQWSGCRGRQWCWWWSDRRRTASPPARGWWTWWWACCLTCPAQGYHSQTTGQTCRLSSGRKY